MTNENNTTQAPTATYIHEPLSYGDFLAYAKSLSGPTIDIDSYYSHVEYMNSPHGLLVLAHRDYDEVVEGIHPATLSQQIMTPKNIVEVLAGDNGETFNCQPIAYNRHWLTRRSQGGLVLAAFSRMIYGGNPEAPRFLAAEGYTLQMNVHDTPGGPLFFVFAGNDGGDDVVHVIRPTVKEAA